MEAPFSFANNGLNCVQIDWEIIKLKWMKTAKLNGEKFDIQQSLASDEAVKWKQNEKRAIICICMPTVLLKWYDAADIPYIKTDISHNGLEMITMLRSRHSLRSLSFSKVNSINNMSIW